MGNGPSESRFDILVVSDSPFPVVKEFLAKEAGIQLKVIRTDHDHYASYTIVGAQFLDSNDVLHLAFMNSDANPLVAMHCLAAADALVLPVQAVCTASSTDCTASSFALMAATLGKGSVIQTAQELEERATRVNGGSPAARADSFVKNVLSPRGTFAAPREDGAYLQEKLPTPEDP